MKHPESVAVASQIIVVDQSVPVELTRQTNTTREQTVAAVHKVISGAYTVTDETDELKAEPIKNM